MNHYKFPQITTFLSVLPFIKNYPEFRVIDKGDYTVINYMVSTDDTFDMIDENDIGGTVRRECRGLKFCSHSGKILARPFHKFFNIGEREETQHNRIDLSRPHQIQEKLDGSMVHPIRFPDGEIRWMTKMGITSVSRQVEEFIRQSNQQKMHQSIAEICIENNWTPIFEFTSPQNRIVIYYDQPQLTLLAIRDNISGEYLDPMEIDEVIEEYQHTLNVIKESIRLSDVQKIVEYTKGLENQEGFVICFDDGHRVKVKSDEYLMLHRTLDMVKHNRHIALLLLNEKLDDAIGKLYSEEQVRVREYANRFMMALHQRHNWILDAAKKAKELYGDDRGLMSREFICKLPNKLDKTLVFGQLNGRDVFKMLIDIAIKYANSNVKFDEFEKWLFGQSS